MIYVNSVAVFPSTKTIKKGEWHQLGVFVCPDNAFCKDVRWHTNQSDIVSVNPTTGQIFGLKDGTATITATALDGSGKSDYIDVTVTGTVPVTSVSLNKRSALIEKNGSITLSATVNPENATNKTIEWSSSNTDIAIVNNGVVCGISAGTAVITASATDGSGKWVRCLVRVTNDILVKSINISAPKTVMMPGESMFATATVLPTNATKKSVCWSSSNSAIITVNENTGLVMAQGIGIATIYATACDGSGTISSLMIKVSMMPISKNAYLTYFEMQNNATLVYEYLLNKGFSKKAACAILGNMQVESTINPGIWQGCNTNRSGGFGLVQWTYKRYLLFDYLSTHGLDEDDLFGQLGYLMEQLNNGGTWWNSSNCPDGYYISFNIFKTENNRSLYDLAAIFCYCFEKPSTPDIQSRAEYANNWYEFFN